MTTFNLNKPSSLSQEQFIHTFGGVYEHSPWIAETLYKEGIDTSFDHKDKLINAMREVVENAGKDAGILIMRAHPELGTNPQTFKKLTQNSQNEQSSAGLNTLEDTQLQNIKQQNQTYKNKFGFPFIIAVTGLSLQDILNAYNKRINNHPDDEYTIAINQVHKIAQIRIHAIS
jgi:OHCU decarboxylase